MGFEKSEVKVGTYRELGVYVETTLDQAEIEMHKACGAKEALIKHSTETKGLPSVLAFSDGQLEKEIPDIDVLKLVKSYIMRCIHSTANLSSYYEHEEYRRRGEVRALKRIHDHLIESTQVEARKIQKVKELIQSGGLEEDEDPRRPPLPLKVQRQAEEQIELNVVSGDSGAIKPEVKGDNWLNGEKRGRKRSGKVLLIKKTPVVKGNNGANT